MIVLPFNHHQKIQHFPHIGHEKEGISAKKKELNNEDNFMSISLDIAWM
jgi:hypothetical protein